MGILLEIFFTTVGIVAGALIGLSMFFGFFALEKHGVQSPLTRMGICVMSATVVICLFSLLVSWITVLTSFFVSVIVIFFLLSAGIGASRPDDPEEIEDRDFY